VALGDVNAITLNKESMMTVCPQCNKEYEPVLGSRDMNDDRSIQEIYPNATAIEREQLITGLCSDKCWDNYLNGDEPTQLGNG